MTGFRLKRGRIQASGAENGSEWRISTSSAWIDCRLWQILTKSIENEPFSSPRRLQIRRVTAVFRLKRGRIQASGAENGSELKIWMRSIRIYCRLLQILAKSDGIWPEMAKKTRLGRRNVRREVAKAMICRICWIC